MFFHYYDISPGLIGLIIWGIISFLLSKQKKKKNSPNDEVVTGGDVIIDKELEFKQFSGVLDPQPPFNFHYDDDFIEYDEDIKLSNEPDNNQLDIQNEEDQPTQISLEPPPLIDNKIDIQLSLFLKSSSNLKIAFLLKEILDKPMALRNNERYRV